MSAPGPVEPELRALVGRLERLDACAVSDALDHLHLPGATLGIHPLWPCPAIAGRVVTVKTVPLGPVSSGQHLATAAIDAAQAGDVIVIDSGARTDVSSWGDLLSTASLGRGVRGVVIDGACRDVDGSRNLGFPVFGRDVVTLTARGRIMQQSWGEPVQIAGVSVRSGDLVIADGSGAVFIPRERAEEVIRSAERLAAKEAAMAEAIRAGRPVTEVMADRAFEAALKEDPA